jgi:peptidoglycan L-alanyl-D-glutamate endopeptidase CwlK
MSTFRLGAGSLKKLEGVHADLQRVVKRAIELTTVDFSVVEGLRSLERQTQLFASGASRTMASRHLTGHAVDLAPYVGGVISWNWPLFFPLMNAVALAAMSEDVPIRWGGVWDRSLSLLDIDNLDDEVAAYMARQKALGNKKPFVDGPHIELPKVSYP